MKKVLSIILLFLITFGGCSFGQNKRRPDKGERPTRGERGGGPRPSDLGESDADLGSAGIAWYPILEDGLAEAKRSNRPIFFMAVASQCGGISGVF